MVLAFYRCGGFCFARISFDHRTQIERIEWTNSLERLNKGLRRTKMCILYLSR
jgi:hypothetical protein